MRKNESARRAVAAICTVVITGWAALAMAEPPCQRADDAEAKPGQAIVAVDECVRQELQRRFPSSLADGADASSWTLNSILASLRSFFASRRIETRASTATSVLLSADVADVRELLKIYLAPLVSALEQRSPEKARLLLELLMVEPNFFISAGGSATSTPPESSDLPNDPLLDSQWAFDRTKVLETWMGAGGKSPVQGSSQVTVAVLDTELDPCQEDLPDASDACDKDNDLSGHGTAVAGVIGAVTDNGYRVAGMNREISLLAIPVLKEGNRGTVHDAALALDEAGKQKATVASLAWGSSCPSTELRNAILRAREKNMLLIAAAGNDQFDLDDHPDFFPAGFRHPDYYCCAEDACMDNLLVVGATDLTREPPELQKDKKASFSSHGEGVVQLGAPGVGITTTGLERESGGIVDASGTSMATAMVAGAAALVAARLEQEAADCGASPPLYSTIRDRLLEGADRVCNLRSYFEQGRRLNVYNAVHDLPGNSETCSQPQPDR
jgi:hypothetical protein